MPGETASQKLKGKLNGRMIRRGDDGYDEARSVWNGMIDKHPAVIIQPKDTTDIADAVNFARENDLCISVKGGGHGVAGKAVCDDGVMIDLSNMKAVSVDPDKKIARVEAGATLADLDSATQKHNLVTTGGMVSETGVAGLTLGGGLGYLARRFGLALDNLVAAEVITADGKILRASETENPDLFWGIRGGGGNFGTIASFEFQLHELGPNVLTAQAFYPFEMAEKVLKAYRELMSDAPDELACYALAIKIPPVEPFPEKYHGEIAIALVSCYSGDAEKGTSLLTPLTELGEPILKLVTPIPYTALQQSFDAGMPDGQRYYWKSLYTNELSDEAIGTFIDHAKRMPGPISMAGFEPMEGAIKRADASKTAFPYRDSKFSFGIWSGWTDASDDDKNITWTRNFFDAMQKYSNGGVYSNYLDSDDSDRIDSAYGDKYERLREIKAKYDPDNLFRMNQNIKPKS